MGQAAKTAQMDWLAPSSRADDFREQLPLLPGIEAFATIIGPCRPEKENEGNGRKWILMRSLKDEAARSIRFDHICEGVMACANWLAKWDVLATCQESPSKGRLDGGW